MNFQMFKLDLEKVEEPEIKLPTSVGSSQNQESSRKISISALLTMPKPLTVWITTDHGKFLKRWEYQNCLLRNLYAGQEATVRTGHETSVQFSSVAQSCPTLCDPMDYSMPDLPVHHQLLEFAQTHIHWVSDTIQPSHPLLSPSPPTFNLSQHWGLFKWVSSSYQVAKVLEFQLQHQSFQNIRLVPNWERSMSRLYIITLLI